jgi:hypothetical protein
VEVMQVVGVIQATAAWAVVATRLEAAVLPEATVILLQVTVLFLQVAVLHLQVAVIHQAVEAIHREVEGIRLEVAVTPCRQRSQAPVELEAYLYRRTKRDMMSVLRQTSPI